jgi:serine/threonine protein kinase
MNPETAATPRCPHCQSPIPDGAPAGLCPRCVLTGAATPTDAGSTSGSRATPPSLDEVATAFPDLEILGLIGTGGMGCVYRVRMKSDGREAALKLLPKSLAADPAFMERFNREARTLSRLKHPNIVGVYGYGQSGGFCHLTMEFVDGANLRQAMRAGRFTAAQALEIVPRLCDALQYAHSQGVLHRDIKPENILLDGQGRVKIADFGIAKLVGDGTGHGADITLTQTGARLGTPHYMAPEQIERPDDVDHRADIYSLGVVFYELLTGELPLGRFPAPSAKTYIDARVDEIVFRALAKERELRQQSAAQVGAEVEGLSTPAPKPKVEPFAAVLRRDACFISNPGYLKTLWAQFYIYTGHGQLELTGDRLSFRGGSSSVEIPLRAISGISLGEYPRLTKPTGLNHVAVRFRREAGAKEEVLLFTPFKSAWNATWTTNAVVDEWHRLLVEAWTRLHGRPPAEVPPGEGTAAPSSGSKSPTVSWMTALAGVGAVGVVAAIWLFVVLGRGNEVIKGGLFATMVLGAASGVGLCLWAMGRIRSGRRLGLLFWIPVVFALAFAVYAATLALLARKSPLPPSFPMPANQVVATNLGGNVGAAKATEPLASQQETKAGAGGAEQVIRSRGELEKTRLQPFDHPVGLPGGNTPGLGVLDSLDEMAQEVGSHSLRLLFAITGGMAVLVLIVGIYRRRKGFVAGPMWRWVPLLLLALSGGAFAASLIAERWKPTLLLTFSPSAEPIAPGLGVLNLVAKDLQPGSRILLQTIYWSNGVPSVIPELETVFEPKELGMPGSQLVWSMEKGSLRFRRSDEDGLPRVFEAGPRVFLCEGKPEWNALNRRGNAFIEFRGLWKADGHPRPHRQLLYGDAVTRDAREQVAGIIPGNAVIYYGIEARFEVVPFLPPLPAPSLTGPTAGVDPLNGYTGTPDPLDGGPEGAALVLLSREANPDPEWIQTTWRFESKEPSTWCVEFQGRSPEVAFASPFDGPDYAATLRLRVEPRKEADGIQLRVFAEDGLLVHERTVRGDPKALMKEAESVPSRGSEAFGPTWPFWLSEVGRERVVVRRRPARNPGAEVRLKEMWTLQQALSSCQKRVQSGQLAPGGHEIHYAESKMEMAAALVHGDSYEAGRAFLEYRRALLRLLESEVGLGRRPKADLEKAKAEYKETEDSIRAGTSGRVPEKILHFPPTAPDLRPEIRPAR